jgi:hypothetical protein
MTQPEILNSVKEHAFSAEDAAQAVGLNPGDKVYMLCSMGDVGPQGSVTVPRGQPAIVKHFYWHGGYWKMGVDMIDSPGQAYICSLLRDVPKFWTTTALPPPPIPKTSLDWILGEDYDSL